MAFAGSNSDVKPNDRLPITAQTHEAICHKKCFVRKHMLKNTTRITQRAQNVTNGYFGGYIGKRQPTGALETKKCIEKMNTLRSKINGRSQFSQARAASARLFTDLEMRSTFRSAVEVLNHCRSPNPTDVLPAECIRTFSNSSLDGRA